MNGIEWELDGATIELDGTDANEADLRIGMVVRIEGDLDSGGQSGSALSVSI